MLCVYFRVKITKAKLSRIPSKISIACFSIYVESNWIFCMGFHCTIKQFKVTFTNMYNHNTCEEPNTRPIFVDKGKFYRFS